MGIRNKSADNYLLGIALFGMVKGRHLGGGLGLGLEIVWKGGEV
jgi:hypothetical protein